jgi:membrane associated rhomboid family serine protease
MFQNLFRNMSPVVKNLLILNVLFFVAQFAISGFTDKLALRPILSDEFAPWQFATHFFMHSTASLMHIFFNMFALVMFGAQLENRWGAKRFLIYYLSAAIGAAVIYQLYKYWDISQMTNFINDFIQNPSSSLFAEFRANYVGSNSLTLEGKSMVYHIEELLNDPSTIKEGGLYAEALMNQFLEGKTNTPMLGASGAVFGLLAAYGYLFPNTELYLMFIPVPVKAKYFVIGYAAIELFSGISNNPNDNVAHFAHLGGALVGIVMVIIWQRQKNQFN